MLSDDNIRYYKIFIVLFPIIFYIPKFFEVSTHYEPVEAKEEINCGHYIALMDRLELLRKHAGTSIRITDDEAQSIISLGQTCKNILIKSRIPTFSKI